jgi:hypothetical protein
MASGRPDYTSQSLIKGSDAGTHRTVAVDPAGNLLTLIKGQFGGAPVTIAVDVNGNILGVLQGDYAGSLKTLAVDDKGRMLAVLTDPEDVFGNPHYMGSAELAARLGSPSMLERSGQVVFLDPGGLNVSQYILTSAGASAAAVESGVGGPSGPLSYKLTAGPAIGNWTALTRRLPLVTLGSCGVEVALQLEPNMRSAELDMTVVTGAGIWYAEILVDLVTNQFLYLNSANVWVALAALPSTITATDNHLLKLTANPITGKYKAFRWDNAYFDMSAIAMFYQVAVSAQQIAARVSLTDGVAADISIYLGTFVLTVNEP